MYDYFNLPIKNNLQVFYAQRNDFQIWRKPKGCRFIHIFALSGGGGGGGPVGSGTGNRIGGGGGGSASFSTLLVPSDLIGEGLSILVGLGGAGGGGGGGTAGTTTQIYGSGGVLLPGRGSPGAGAGAGGAGGSNPSLLPYKNIGIDEASIFAQSGGAGVSAASGTSISVLGPWSSGAAGGGASSGGTSFVGGNIIGSGYYPTILGGQTPGENGNDGISYLNVGGFLNSQLPFLATGGAGGAANATGTGGNGGNGGFGCGGGGGGAGVTGGRGGNGGNGLVIITWF